MEKPINSKYNIKAQDSVEEFQYLMYKLYYKDVFRTVYYITKDKELSKELTNEAYLKAYNKLETLNDINKFKQWVCVISANLAKNHIRKNNKFVSSYPMETLEDDKITEDIVLESIEKEETKETVQKALNQLDPDSKEIITLRYYHDLNYEELAKSLCLKKGTIKSRLNRAKNKLYNILKLVGEKNEQK